MEPLSPIKNHIIENYEMYIALHTLHNIQQNRHKHKQNISQWSPVQLNFTIPPLHMQTVKSASKWC